jgi:hypothetical protein
MTEVWVALAAFVAIVLLILWGRRPTRLLSGKRGRLPKHLELAYIPTGDIPADAQRPLGYLADRLSDLGFEVADLPARVPALQRFGHRLIVVPFVHPTERAYFLMGIEGGLLPKTQLVLHIISQFTDGRRVETTTLAGLGALTAPENVNAQVVLDADTIDEIWSRHRRALTDYERDLRAEVLPDNWRTVAVQTYDGWVQSAVRAHRLQLEPDGIMYRIRNPSGSAW